MIEIKDTNKKDVKRLIIYSELDDTEQSYGVKLHKKELYNLYIDLKEILKEIDKTLIKD